MTVHNRVAVVLVLGTAQTLGWASTFYLPAILGDRIAKELGMSSTWFFAAFSGALVVSAMVGPRAGRTVDAIGGRGVLAASNVIFAAGLTALAFAHSQTTLWLAWLILGVGMGIGLYDTAFAALGRIYGLQARSSITGITLLAGFAGTIGWPLTAWGASELGWRETCLAWAAAHLVYRPAPQSLASHVCCDGHWRRQQQAPHSHRPSDDRPRLGLRGVVDGGDRDGCALAAPSGSGRRQHRASSRRGGADWPFAG
jgi:MFS family permease